MPCFSSRRWNCRRDLVVHARQDAVEEFDRDHLRAQPPPDRAELEPDHARADHQQPFRHLVQHQCAGRRHDALLVDVDTGKPRHIRAGGDDDGLALDHLAVPVGLDLDAAGRGDAPHALEACDLVLLEQERDALHVALDALVLELHHGGEIELRRAHGDAHPPEQVTGFIEQLGGMQQRLRGNASDIEAGAAEGLVLLHHRHLHAELCRADGADIAAGTRADDDEVVGHTSLVFSTGASKRPRSVALDFQPSFEACRRRNRSHLRSH